MIEKQHKLQVVFLRLIAGLITILSALYGPWWFFLALIIILPFCFSWFFEGIIAALLHDALYSLALSHFMGLDILMVLVASLSVSISVFIRRRLRNITSRYP